MSSGFARGIVVAVLVAAAVVMWGCDECKRSTDCGIGEVCQNGSCVPQGLPDSMTDPDTDTVDPDAPDGLDMDADPDTVDPDAPVDTTDEDVTGDTTTDVADDGFCSDDAQCLDDNPCTDDYCEPSFHMCVNLPLDGRDCSPGDLCDGVGTCDDTGACVLDSSPLCDDFNECTFDTCLTGASDCEYDAVIDGTSCDNGLYCDGADECSGGICRAADSTARPCDDANACTLDYCAEGSTGPECTHEATGSFRAVACGTTATGATSGSGEIASYGSCTGTLGSGPEEMLVFMHDSATSVTFTLVVDSGVPTADYNELYVLTDGCDASTCTDTDGTSVTVSGLGASTPIYIAVESVDGGAMWAVQATCF